MRLRRVEPSLPQAPRRGAPSAKEHNKYAVARSFPIHTQRTQRHSLALRCLYLMCGRIVRDGCGRDARAIAAAAIGSTREAAMAFRGSCALLKQLMAD